LKKVLSGDMGHRLIIFGMNKKGFSGFYVRFALSLVTKLTVVEEKHVMKKTRSSDRRRVR